MVYKVDPLESFGLQDVKLTHPATVRERAQTVFVSIATHGFIRNVVSQKAHGHHVSLRWSHNVIVTDSFFNETVFNGPGNFNGYGVLIRNLSTKVLVTNNIFRDVRHTMPLEVGSNYNIFSYNFTVDTVRDYCHANGETECGSNPDACNCEDEAWINGQNVYLTGDVAVHGNFAHYNLYEGNVFYIGSVDHALRTSPSRCGLRDVGLTRVMRLHLLCAISAFAGLVFVSACRSTPDEPKGKPGPSAKPSRTLTLEGVEVQVPHAMVDLEPDRVKRLKDAAERAEPNAKYFLSAVRDSAGMAKGTVYVQRTEMTRRLPQGAKTVREAIKLTHEELKQMLAASGLRVVHSEEKERDGGVETCLEMQMSSGGKVAAMDVCTLLYVAKSERMRGLTVNCMTKPGERLCMQALETRKYTVKDAMALDAPVTPVEAPGIEGVGRSNVAGLVFGSSKAAFESACRKAGFKANQFDWENEAPGVRNWVKEGRVAQCSGLPGKLALGSVVQANVIFQNDKLVSMSIFLSDAPADINKKLSLAYPDRTQWMGRSVHVVNREASANEVISVAVGPSRVPGAKSVLSFLSRAGMDMPPLSP